mmetsp:Transcript_14916/g.27587  ORF Transcript_14916/g.27587 Transcript_14916/m.27587 type:complete len:291 (+) Transcript_14916:51-923(+)
MEGEDMGTVTTDPPATDTRENDSSQDMPSKRSRVIVDILERTKSCNAPSGHLLGNFPLYYAAEFNPPEKRMQVFQEDFWTSLVQSIDPNASGEKHLTLLDIGCNDGTLTSAFRKALMVAGASSVEAVGVDVDPSLIDRANASFPNCTFFAGDCAAEDPLPVLEIKTFDIVMCFGTTMWVHLNHGDAGLSRLLERLRDATNHALLLEPQQWKSYRKAKRRLRVANASIPASFFQIKIEGEEAILAHVNEVICAKLSQKQIVGKTAWGRTIFVFQRHSAPSLTVPTEVRPCA